MIPRIRKLFARYAARHISLNIIRGPWQPHGKTEGAFQLNQCHLNNNQLKLAGTSSADQISVTLGGVRRVVVPSSDTGQFVMMLPFRMGIAYVTCVTGDHAFAFTLPPLPAWRMALARLSLWPRFTWAMIRAVPAALRWFRHADPASRTVVRDLLGLAPLVEALQLDANVLHSEKSLPATSSCTVPLVIVMPVYNALDVMQEALRRVVAHTEIPWHLILIEDCSSDARVREWLRSWATSRETVKSAAAGSVVILENEQNLGFIGSVNRGFDQALRMLTQEPDEAKTAIVILNSDALVPMGWARRLVAPLWADQKVASVTPMSNDAELMTTPVLCACQSLQEGTGDALDQIAISLSDQGVLDTTADLPTGVGFCMALSLKYLRLTPQFDAAFGAGYGEEVDWCQKSIERGGRHVAATNLFVEHRGGASFGSEQKQILLRKNGEILSARYPMFDQQVQDFIAADPLLSSRLILALGWVAQEAKGQVAVFLGHSMGGGADLDLQRRIKHEVDAVGAGIVLRVGGSLRWQIEVHTPVGATRGATDDDDFVCRLIDILPQRRVVYSCGVGDRDPISLPDILLTLQGSGGLEILMHDFLPISPSYTLLDHDNRFQGVPDAFNMDPAHQQRRPDGTVVSLQEWRYRWGRLMQKADRIEVFSNNSCQLVEQAYRAVDLSVEVCPHQLLHPVSSVAVPTAHTGPVIGVLGNIGMQKGAGVVAQLSRHLERSREARLVVIGNVDPAYSLKRPAKIHGDYEIADIAALTERYAINCWLIPSIWPETFSFVTHEALATGLPVFAFDLGAQGDLVAERQGPENVIPLKNGQPDLDILLERVSQINEVNRHD